MANVFLYMGKVLPKSKPPPKNLLELHHNDFLQEDMERLKLHGIPHIIEHHKNLPVGKVVYSTNHQGEKYIVGYIRLDNPFGKSLVDEITKGNFRDLSLSHDYTLAKTPIATHEFKHVREVSSVQKANRPTCRILSGTFTRLDDERYI